ncbi:MAG: 16S rRNA (uracil1498-N3)-methyltransferase [Alphaproteobacteria bacterium]
MLFTEVKKNKDLSNLNKLKKFYFDGDLSVGSTLNAPKELSRRLSRELKQKKDDHITLFNGQSGLFEIEIKDDKCTNLYVKSIIKPQEKVVNITLLISLVSEEALENIFRQATEFGVTEIIPLITDNTVIDKLNEAHINELLIATSEQCARLTIPQLRPISFMETVVKEFGDRIYWCAEHVGGKWGDHKNASGNALLIGPENGFSSRERVWLNECLNVIPVGLGKNILKPDTAACAALSRFLDHF